MVRGVRGASARRLLATVVRSNLLTLVISISAFVGPARARVTVLVHAGSSVLSDGVHRARFADTIARFRSVAGSQRGAADCSRRGDAARRLVTAPVSGGARRVRLELTRPSVAAVIITCTIVVRTIALLSGLDDAIAAYRDACRFR